LSGRAKVAVALSFVFVCGLGVVAALAVAKRRAEHARRQATVDLLTRISAELKRPELVAPRADGSMDETGQYELVQGLCLQLVLHHIGDEVPERGAAELVGALMTPAPSHLVEDGWGRPLRYRCPGTVHRRRWDLYSVGPNGVDEQGQGDDLMCADEVTGLATTGTRR
jgi:hypothetical protein